ncbi:MAG: nucleoside-diphosphate kinase [Candidatus Helarchaeota archaeon]
MPDIERSLVLLKPDAWLRKYIGAKILEEFLNRSDFRIVSFKQIKASPALARKHYEEHEGKSFYQGLIHFICLSPILAMEIEGNNVIKKIRDFLGATFVQKADANSIRGKYGIWAGINLVHASDSPISAERELNLWKEHGKMERLPDSIQEVKKYVSKWKTHAINRTQELRRLCKELIERPENQKRIKSALTLELEKECVETDSDTITRFADIIMNNILGK